MAGCTPLARRGRGCCTPAPAPRPWTWSSTPTPRISITTMSTKMRTSMRQTCQRCVTCPRLFTFSELECEYVVYDRIADKSGPRTETSCTSIASWASTGAWRARCAGRSSGRATASCSVYPPPSAATASSTARTAPTRTSAETVASFVYIFPIITSLSNMLHTKVIDLIEIINIKH